MLLPLVVLLLHFSILVQLLAICCFGNKEPEELPTPPPRPPSPPPETSQPRSPERVQETALSSTKEGLLPEEKTQDEEKTPELGKQVKVRELADESQMSKSLKKVDSTEMSYEVDDPFDTAQLPLPAPELRNSTRPPAVSA